LNKLIKKHGTLRDERVLASEYKLISLKERKLQKRIEQATATINSQKSHLYRSWQEPTGDVEGYYSRYFNKDTLTTKEKNNRAKIRGQCPGTAEQLQEKTGFLSQHKGMSSSKNIRMSQSTALLAF
jgi:Txe/YoeB family toxin of Txe-Axe toxin-antitoxin module